MFNKHCKIYVQTLRSIQQSVDLYTTVYTNKTFLSHCRFGFSFIMFRITRKQRKITRIVRLLSKKERKKERKIIYFLNSSTFKHTQFIGLITKMDVYIQCFDKLWMHRGDIRLCCEGPLG